MGARTTRGGRVMGVTIDEGGGMCAALALSGSAEIALKEMRNALSSPDERMSAAVAARGILLVLTEHRLTRQHCNTDAALAAIKDADQVIRAAMESRAGVEAE